MTRFSLGIWGNTVSEMAGVAVQAEAAGFETVWAHELHRSPIVPITVAASQTSRIGLGTGVLLAFTRSPLVMALTALDLDELSGGRFKLGLGTGVKRLNESWHGATFGSPVKHLREAVEAIRALSSGVHVGKPISYPGEYYNLDVRGFKRPWAPVRDTVPIYLAAVGPLMSRLAGSHGDGWIGHELNSRKWMEEVILPNIVRGLKEAGRDRNEFDAVLTVCCAVNESRQEAIRQAAGSVAFYATVRTYHEFFASSGFGDEAIKIGQLFREGNIEAMIDAVPEEMVHTFAVAGTADEVRSRLKELEDLGDELHLSPPHTFLSGEEIAGNLQSIIALVDGWS